MKTYDDLILDDLRILRPLKYQRYSPIRRIIVNALAVIALRLIKPRRSIVVKRFWMETADGHQIRITRYRHKATSGPRPALLYFHGGSFQLEETPIHIRMVCELVDRTTFDAYAVRYRLAPKWPYPQGLMDCYQALCWLDGHKKEYGNDRLIVVGDSAGGNLAASVAIMSRDFQGPVIDRQMLIYPVIARDLDTPSMAMFDKTPVFNSVLNRSMWNIYCPKESRDTCRGLPLEADKLYGLPPAYIETAEFDPLRDEGILYAQRLRDAKVCVHTSFTIGTVHGYDGAFMSKSVKSAAAERAQFLMRTLSDDGQES